MLGASIPKRLQRKIKQREKERRIVNKCMRRRMAYNARVGATENLTGEQYLELPRAICDPNGTPHKGQKSYTTKWLEKRIILNNMPSGWKPNTVVLEGMFLINVTPLGTHSTMKEYADFLIRRFALWRH